MKSSPPVRVHSQALSLWQSVVAAEALKLVKADLSAELSEGMTTAQILDHPMILATNHFVKKAEAALEKGEYQMGSEWVTTPETDPIAAYLSELAFAQAQAKLRGDTEAEQRAYRGARPYSDHDLNFASCFKVYYQSSKEYDNLKYNDWTIEGNNDIQYGVIDYKIPNDGKVAIIGDWGTGLNDAKHLLKTLMKQHKPDVLIHLGDIYYSATADEVQDNFASVITDVFNDVLGQGKRIPVFNIPGNHDYYSYGYPLYDMVADLNNGIAGAKQEASYFCLRTEDNGWQFLGMDTGYGDANPKDQVNAWYAGPKMHKSEVQWHQDKLENFDGATILLSHHQLFSHNAKINGMKSVYSAYPNLNKYLLDYFQPFFGDKVAAWLWGHEHNQVLYENNLYGLPKGRLIGASAFEEMTSESPYEVKYPNCPIQSQYKLDKSNGYYDHGYAIIDLERDQPTDSVKITFMDYPSWYQPAPDPIPNTASKIRAEELQLHPKPANPSKVHFDDHLHFCLEDGNDYIGPYSPYNFNNYPPITTQAAKLVIKSASGKSDGDSIRSGDKVYIMSLESGLGSKNILSALGTPSLVYHSSSSIYHQNWFIVKLDSDDGDDYIYEGTPVCFKSTAYTGAYMCPYVETLFDGTWMSYDKHVKSKWFLEKT